MDHFFREKILNQIHQFVYKKFCFEKLFQNCFSNKNLFSKIENGQVVENLYPEKMIHDLSESHHL